MNYMISYDLNKKDKNYEGLIEAIKNISNGVWCSPCKSTWIIQSNVSNSRLVYEHLEKEIDKNDYIVVANITKDMSGFMSKEVADYIGEHFM